MFWVFSIALLAMWVMLEWEVLSEGFDYLRDWWNGENPE